jgi:hypothetical protein
MRNTRRTSRRNITQQINNIIIRSREENTRRIITHTHTRNKKEKTQRNNKCRRTTKEEKETTQQNEEKQTEDFAFPEDEGDESEFAKNEEELGSDESEADEIPNFEDNVLDGFRRNPNYLDCRYELMLHYSGNFSGRKAKICPYVCLELRECPLGSGWSEGDCLAKLQRRIPFWTPRMMNEYGLNKL